MRTTTPLESSLPAPTAFRLRCGVAVFAFLLLPSMAKGQTPTAANPSSSVLADAVKKLGAELALTPEQSAKAGALVAERLPKAQAAVGTFGDISLDSVLDLLNEARSIRDEFIPKLTALLTPEQKERLAKLPGKTQLWVDVAAAWMAEARVRNLAERVKLTDLQAGQIRELLVKQFSEAGGVMEGLLRKEGTSADKRAVLDAVLDLRAAVRSAQRQVDRLLTPEQRKALEAYKIESEKASQTMGDPR